MYRVIQTLPRISHGICCTPKHHRNSQKCPQTSVNELLLCPPRKVIRKYQRGLKDMCVCVCVSVRVHVCMPSSVVCLGVVGGGASERELALIKSILGVS